MQHQPPHAETPPVESDDATEDPLATLNGSSPTNNNNIGNNVNNVNNNNIGNNVNNVNNVNSNNNISTEQQQLNNIGENQQPCDPVVALDHLNVELGRLRETKSDCALFRAYAARPQLFDDEHKRGFLHTENYVVKAAADRMIAYWEARADLFGEERMLLPMDRSGTLNGEDSLALDQGLLQLLPQKDLDGHGLIFFDPSRHNTKLSYSIESMLRVIWYIMHVAKEDPIINENGFVLIVYPKQCTPEQIDRNFIAKGTTIIGSVMPLPWKGFHICHPCSSYNKYFPLVKMLSPTRIKDNIAVHFGTDEHVLECMEGYALPADRLPTELGGRDRLDYTEWLSDRKNVEGVDALRVSTPRPPSAHSEASDEVMKDAPKSPKKSAKAKTTSATKPKGTTTTSRPKTKRNIRTPSPSPPQADAAKSSAAVGASPTATTAGGAAKTRRPGRKGDARMHRAVTLKIENPETSLVEALQEGGFNFDGLKEKGKPHHEVFDQDGVSLMQRKNQLLRRIRVEKKKKKEEA